METRQADVTAEAGARKRDDFARMCDLEYALVRAHNSLAVITRGLCELVNDHAGEDERTLTAADVSFLFGAVNLLEGVADECDRAVGGTA